MGSAPDAKDVEITVLRHQLTVLRRPRTRGAAPRASRGARRARSYTILADATADWGREPARRTGLLVQIDGRRAAAGCVLLVHLAKLTAVTAKGRCRGRRTAVGFGVWRQKGNVMRRRAFL